MKSTQMQYFKEVLNAVGVTLEFGETPNVFQKEQSLIIRDIEIELKKHINFPSNISNFVAGLKVLITKDRLFKKALLPSIFHQISDEFSSGKEQESLFRCLLNIDCIQSEIVQILLQKVMIHGVVEQEDTTWLRLMLGTLRYLSYINDSKMLTTKLLEILEVASYPAQLQILNFLPDIIPDSEYDETAKQLGKLLDKTSTLTRAIIDCLNNLNLNPDTKADIEDHILTILNTTMDLKTFSLTFCFLITDCNAKNLPNILLKTRNALNSIMITQIASNKDAESDQVLAFQEIRSITTKSKTVSEGWFTIINNIRNSSDHKSVDFIILLMLHSTGGQRKHLVESIFKKKIKNGHFKLTLLETTLQKYLAPQILKEYLKSIQEIAGFLLRLSNEPLCLEFAKNFFTITFNHKYADRQQRQQILNSLILLKGSSDGKKNIPALSILKAIAEQNMELLQPHTMQLIILLDKIEESNLVEVKQMFDLLCGLTCGPKSNDSMSALYNEIRMIVRKQLGSSNKIIKYKGIIAAVAIAKNMAINLEDQDSCPISEESFSSVSDLPNGPAKDAASLLESVHQSTLNCPIGRGLYYDQLAQMVVTIGNLDKHFMVWLFDSTTMNFQETYLTENQPEPLNDIKITIQYNLNSSEEMQCPISIKLAELTIKSNENNNLMLVFAPLFRLLRLIHCQQHDGNLNTIDALLGCGITLPEIDPDVGIEMFDSEQSKQVVNCLFHCINWFREIISAFVTQNDRKIKQKILNRLKQLVEMEELFINCIKCIPDHKLPPCYFYNTNLDNSSLSTQSLDKGKKKRNIATQNTTKITQLPGTSTTITKSGRKPQSKEKEIPEFQFREMDIDIIVLLRYPLKIEDETVNEKDLYLTIPQYKFIIKDLVNKINNVMKSNTELTLTHLATIKVEDLIKDCVKLMPHINNCIIKIIDELKKLLQRTDGIHDAHEMFLPPATELKHCFSLTLELQGLILNSSILQYNKNLPILRDYLKACIETNSSQMKSAQGLINEYLKCIMILADYCLTLPCAVNLINIVKALCNLTDDPTAKKQMILLSGKLLSIRWFNLQGLPETGAIANIHIDALVKAHLNGSNLETISSVVSWIHAESPNLKSKDDKLATFPSITKSNFPILYRGVCSGLFDTIQNELQDLTNMEHLETWLNIVVTLRNLMDIVKSQETRTNLSVFLKKSLAILKIFLSHGLPILEIMLKSHSDKVVEILRTLQQTTRFIHNLCCHSKVTKDSALIAHVPLVRLTLETLVYRVKAALVANNCSAAFWMGNLRNKNLQGEEILTQSTVIESSLEQQDSEEDLPVDDESDTETNFANNAEENDEESSEIV